MTPISFDDAQISNTVAARWCAICDKATERLRSMGVTVDHGEEELFVLPDGRLQITVQLATTYSVIMYADPGEWRRVSNN